MESLTRLVTESFARHGFDRPLDYRRLRWSRWFRCESHHSLLQVPSKPGVFALAEEIVDFGTNHQAGMQAVEEITPTGNAPRRMLAVTQFFADDDMAFVLDRMLARQNPMSDRLASGRYFIRYVIIEDAAQRRSVYNALNQWLADRAVGSSAVSYPESESSIASHFASSLELTPATEYVPTAIQASLFETAGVGQTGVGRTLMSVNAGIAKNPSHLSEINQPTSIAVPVNSGAATNTHCSSTLPSGF
jgi:hypothetical protein